MKAIRVTAERDGNLKLAPLPLPTMHRKGDTSAERYRQQSRGEVPRGNYFNPIASNALRAIRLSDGKFRGLASQPGSLLTFVTSGTVTVVTGPSQTSELMSGDILLTDGRSSSEVTLDVRDQCRLLQIDVATDWPGPDAEIQGPGTISPRQGSTPNIKRVYKGADDKAYFLEFPELFRDEPDLWSAPVKIAGFRMLCDLGETPAGLWMVDAQSQSGHCGSPHYRDQFQNWLRGEYHFLPLDREEARAGFTSCLRFDPGSGGR